MSALLPSVKAILASIAAGGGGGGLTDFNDIGGCIMKCLAADVTGYSSGDRITSDVADLSSGGAATMTTTLGYPIFRLTGGKPVLYFAADKELYSTVDLTSALPLTIIVRGRITGDGAIARIFNAKLNNWLLGWWASFLDECFADNWVALQLSVHTDILFHTYALTLGTGGTVGTLYAEDGSIIANTSGSFNGPGKLGVNCGSELSDCEMTGIVVYDSILLAPDLAAAIILMNTL